MCKLIAWVFMYSLDGLLADEGTEYWQFCFGLPVEPADLKQKIGVYQGAYAHIMGRAAYEGMAGALPTAGHPFTGIMNAARKVVFSRTLRTAEWASTTIAAGDTTEEIDNLMRGGDGHIVVWGGAGFCRSLMRLDLIDEFRVDLHPYVAGEGTRWPRAIGRGRTTAWSRNCPVSRPLPKSPARAARATRSRWRGSGTPDAPETCASWLPWTMAGSAPSGR